jgi:hypothetical protein
MLKRLNTPILTLITIISPFFYTGCNNNTTNGTGIMNNLPINDVIANGWTECYKETYAHSGDDLATLKDITCSGHEIMLACKETNSSILRVAAYADHDDVFYDTSGGDTNITHRANGVDWYFYDSVSMGFTPIGVPINLTNSDVYDNNGTGWTITLTNNQKLSWLTDSGNTWGGWRCGDVGSLYGSEDWEKIIYQRN